MVEGGFLLSCARHRWNCVQMGVCFLLLLLLALFRPVFEALRETGDFGREEEWSRALSSPSTSQVTGNLAPGLSFPPFL